MNLRFIKKKTRNALIVLVYLTGLPYLRFLFFRLKGVPLVRVLCWHKIPSKEQFANKIGFLQRHFNIVSIEDFAQGGNLCLDRINLVISFDDGYKSWLENAVPVLLDQRLPALFFVSSGYVGLGLEEEREAIKNFRVSWAPGLSLQDLKEIASWGIFTIGAHGGTHRDLSTLKEEDFYGEIETDRENLERMSGREIFDFAIPFGHKENFNPLIFRYYSRVFSIIPGFNRGITPGREIHRDCIDLSFSHLVFRAWLMGAYDFYWRLL